MSTIPTSAFVRHVQDLSHAQFQRFVAELWSQAGWDSSLDGDVVVATKDNRTKRLLVVPSGHIARFRWQAPESDQFETVVSAQLIGGESRPRGVPEGPLVDASDLRHRLVYGCDSDDAQHLCTQYLGVPFQDSDWEATDRRFDPVQLGQAVVALVLVGSALGVLTLGIPFIQAETAPEPVSSSLGGSVDTGITTPPPQQTTAQPTGLALSETVYVTTENGRLLAIDRATGEEIWRTDVGDRASAPLVVDGVVYLSTRTSIHAVDTITGDERWVYSAAQDLPTRPTVVNGTLYTSDGDRLLAVDARRGTLDWDSSLAEIRNEPTVYNGTVYVQNPGGRLWAVDAEDGETSWEVTGSAASYWSTSVGIPDARTPTGAQTVTAAIDDTLFGYDTESGERRWSYQSRTPGPLSTPVVVNGTNSLAVEGAVARNATTNTVAYVSDARAYFYAIDTATGEELWTYEKTGVRFQYPTVGAPVANETAHSVYISGASPITDYESAVVALNASTGQKRWAYTSQNKTFGIPTVANETLYVGTEDGALVALGTENRTERWRADVSVSDARYAPTVVTDPTSGDSVDSRVRLGTNGHHDWLTGTERSPHWSGLSVLNTTVTRRVAASEQLSVTVTLVNRNDSRETSSVRVTPGWTSDTAQSFDTDVTLEAGEAERRRFSIAAPDEPGNYSTAIELDGKTFTTTTTVTERPTFDVAALNDPGQVWRDGQGEIIASIHNTGDVAATTPIVFEFNGERVETRERTIGANDTVSETFTVSPGDRTPGNYTYAVGTADDGNSTELEIRELDRRADAIPIVTRVFGLTLLLSGLGLGWRVISPFGQRVRRRLEQFVGQ